MVIVNYMYIYNRLAIQTGATMQHQFGGTMCCKFTMVIVNYMYAIHYTANKSCNCHLQCNIAADSPMMLLHEVRIYCNS